MRSLRVKMTILIVLVVLVSTSLLSLISYRRAKNSMFSQLEKNNSVAAEKYAQELTAWVNTHAKILDTMAADIEVSGVYKHGYGAFHQYLMDSCDILNQDGYIYDIYFTYPDNTMACASDFVADGSVDYVHDRDWYTEAARTKELYYSIPYMDSDTKMPIVTISKAVYKDGELQGVLAADIFVDTLVNIINEAEVEKDSYAFLVDRNMGMIVHPNEAYDFDDKPKGIMQVTGSPYEDVLTNIRKGSSETVYVKDYDGVTRGIVVAKMENTGWYVGIATSKAELMESVTDLMKGFLIATGIAVVIGIVSAGVLAIVLDRLSKQQQEYEARVLRLEKQAADEASKAKSRFLADMSHEIRTPINAILGMNEMIMRESDDGDIQEYSHSIKQSGQNLLQLINSILDFSKIEDGKMELVPGPYWTNTLITYVKNSIAERARAKELELILAIDPKLPSELYGDEMKISEIIMNLLTNAVKYTEEGSVKLTITEKERKTDPETGEKSSLLYVEVKDTGIGIKEDDMEKLFESFERLDVVRNRNIEGTGLGISITTKLLALMGSELKVSSKYGEGSVFSFDLWQKIENEEALGDYQQPSSADETSEYKESFHAPSARILVVDDTKLNISVVVNLLKKTGVKIDTATSGMDAVKLASEKAYDLILMDQRMPGMDGTEAMRKIRDDIEQKNAMTPVICLTADVIRGARERYIAEGFDDYLTKPVDGRVLERMLLEYLPEEKIRIEKTLEEERATENEEVSALFAALKKAGVDTKTGMFFCANDEEMYKSILSEYCMEQKSKSHHLVECFEKKDWKNYEIYAHSLKSTSKTIGAYKLFEIAAKMEAAASKGEELSIEDNHAKMMDLYESIVRVIESNLEVAKAPSEDEEEIFEFLPEGDKDELG